MAEHKSELDKKFEEAVRLASDPELKFPADIRLYFYAYYKRAVGNHNSDRMREDNEKNALISGFKMNALFQVRNIPIEEAKKRYIELVNEYIIKGKTKSEK